MRKALGGLFLLLVCSTGITRAQVELSEESTKKEEKEKAKKIAENEAVSSEVFFFTNWSSTSRLLRESDGLLGKPLGERAEETSLNTWSFGLGIRNQITSHFAWEGGISYLRNGESFLYERTDSMFSYQTTYSYIAMPLKALYTYDAGDLRFFAGGGLVPQMFSGYRQDQQWKTKTNATDSQTIKQKNGYATVALSAVFNVGFQVRFQSSWSLLIMPEYRYQLTNSYVKNNAYEHFGRAIGVNMGITRKL